MPSSCLVPKVSQEKIMKHFSENFYPRDYFNETLPLLELDIGPIRSSKVFLQIIRDAKTDVIVETSSSAYGVSLKQDQDDYADDRFIQLVEINKESLPKGAINRRFWGTVEVKFGDPFYKPVLKRGYQILWANLLESLLKNIEPTGYSPSILELKCQCTVNEGTSRSIVEEFLYDGNFNLELEELLRRIEQDVMSLNKSYGKLK
ncbi:putative disease resistance protein (TIR-NBS-LRR class), partial [Trifolium medium]|nr:putative disease resistance protein (TIR-NBS-LRR class) [Trifolium medium]